MPTILISRDRHLLYGGINDSQIPEANTLLCLRNLQELSSPIDLDVIIGNAR